VIVLDTHALVWWISDSSRVGARARRAIDAAVRAKEPIGVSCISAWEITMLVKADRLRLTIPVDDWLAKVEGLPFFEFFPVDNRVGLRAVTLDGFTHKDPADRIIVATALGVGAALVTADERLQAYRPLKTIWA
jgi:PIN domain nuclease of toxin-antitoxin system